MNSYFVLCGHCTKLKWWLVSLSTTVGELVEPRLMSLSNHSISAVIQDLRFDKLNDRLVRKLTIFIMNVR